MKRLHLKVGGLTSALLLLVSNHAWAFCEQRIEPGFIGEVCNNSEPNKCYGEVGLIECRGGRWLLEDGGVFQGSSKAYYADLSGLVDHRITKAGRLRTPQFEGQLEETATEWHQTSSSVSTVFTSEEKRTGTETLPDGGVFKGVRTTTTNEWISHTGVGDGVSMTKEGALFTDLFSGKLRVQTRIGRDKGQVYDDVQTTLMVGTWTLGPNEKLRGSLETSVVKGVKTVTDKRVPVTE